MVYNISMKKFFIILSIILFAITSLTVSRTEATNVMPSPLPSWWGRLYTPTQITKLGDKWFIVDCWHNRVIYSTSLTKPIKDWSILDKDLASPHSIASDGTFYAVEDTMRHAINFYKFVNNQFVLVQRFSNLGLRPHYITYHSGVFKMLSADSGEMFHFQNINGTIVQVLRKRLPLIDTSKTMHIRSYAIYNNLIYFTATPNQNSGNIIVTDMSYNYVRTISVPATFKDMNHIFFYNNKVIVTATPQAITILNTIDEISTASNKWAAFGFKGTPYYSTYVDSKLFVPEITEYSRVASWRIYTSPSLSLGLYMLYNDSGIATSDDILERGRFW